MQNLRIHEILCKPLNPLSADEIMTKVGAKTREELFDKLTQAKV